MDLIGLFKNKIKIYEIDFKSIDSTGYIDKLYDEKARGIIIRNLFSEQEVSQMLLDLNKISEFDSPHEGASVYPFPCSSLKYKLDFGAFFEDTRMFMENYNTNFNVDFVERTIDLIKKISRTNVEIAQSPFGSFLPGTFRIINDSEADIGLTQVHIGIEYAKRCIEDGSYKYLQSNVNVLKQLSFFTVLQQSVIGGEFTVFDFKYSDYDSISGKFINNSKTKKKKKLYSRNYFKTLILKPGDAFIFPDYSTWHRVEPVKGGVNRITYGFWWGYDIENKNIKIWS